MTLTNGANTVSGNGSGLTNFNAGGIASGTMSDARLSANVVLVDGSRSFTGTINGITPTAAAHLATKGYVDQSATNAVVSGTAAAAAVNRSYILTNASQSTLHLPGTANVGDIITVSGSGAGGWILSDTNGATISGGSSGTSGVIWKARESSRTWTGFPAVASSSDGAKVAAIVNPGQIYTSTDSGVTWTARDSSRAWRAIASSADGTKLAAAVANGQIYTSTDSGVTWTARETSRNWWSIASSSDGTKLVATVRTGQIYTSTDSGVTWTARDSVRGWFAVASSADGTKLAAGVDNGKIYTSTDSGVNWTVRTTVNGGWTAIASSSDGTKLVAIDQYGVTFTAGKIYTSTDSGVTWTARESDRAWRGVASSSDGTKLVANVNNGQIYTSTDSGVTWTARDSNRSWSSVASSTNGTKLVATVSGGQIYTAVPEQTISGSVGDIASVQYIGNNTWQALVESQLSSNVIVDKSSVMSASPSGTTIGAEGGTGNDVTGGALTLAGGNGTGTGGGGAIIFKTAPAAMVNPPDANPNTLAEVMRIDAAGNVGIGQASPTAKLDVNGTIKGGTSTTVDGTGTFIGGGQNHNLTSTSDYSGVASGDNNDIANANYAFVGGGQGNNIATGANKSVIGGGNGNTVAVSGAFIGSGNANNIESGGNTWSFIGAGAMNDINGTADSTVIVGGQRHTNSSQFGFIGGGRNNNIGSGQAAVVVGGETNTASGAASFVGGGIANTNTQTGGTIGGGSSNRVNGAYATVPGGAQNEATAAYAFAAGFKAKADHAGAFVWGDGTTNAAESTTANQFKVVASGGVVLTTSAASFGVSINTGGGQLTYNGNQVAVVGLSDRTLKKNIAKADSRRVLEKLAKLPIAQWNYKKEEDGHWMHIGPMVQDFNPAFFPGREDKYITTLEIGGVALAAIQGLNQKLEVRIAEKNEEIRSLRESDLAQEKEVSELRSLVLQLQRQMNGTVIGGAGGE